MTNLEPVEAVVVLGLVAFIGTLVLSGIILWGLFL